MILLFSPALAATLSGTVTGADGSPLAGVDVVAYDTRLDYASARTTSDGGFSIGLLPPGRYRIRVLPADDDPHVDRFLPDAWDFCEADVVELSEGEVRDGLDAELPLGARITGRVLSAGGEPLPGTQLLAIGQSERSSLVSRLAEADDDGVFRIVGLDSDPGSSEPYAVYLAAEGRPRQYLGPSYDEDYAAIFDVSLGEALEVGDQPILEGISVSGTVTGPDGPVASGTVYVYSSSQVIAVEVEEDGTYIADGLPPGEVVPWASSDGLATTYYPDADRPGARIDAPDEGQALTGADLTLPVENTLTITLAGEGDLSEAAMLLYNDTYTVGRGGGFAEDGTVTVDGLHPGTYFLYVYGADVGFTDDFARDGAGAIREIVVDGATQIDVTMPAGASFAGTVRGDDGAPVYGAYVYATTADGEDTVVGVTDKDGNYDIPGLVGDDFTLRASYAHYCPNDPGWVTVYWPEALVADDAIVTTLGDGEARTGVDFTLFVDDDHDAMGDAWERENGLDPNRDDAGEDPDGDGYLNVEEWALGTDPTGGALAGDGCGSGCGSGASALLLVLPLVGRRRRSAACTGTPRSRAFRW